MTRAPESDPFRLIQEAASFAARQHRHQIRKDGKTPYVAHVFRVAMTVRHVFGCEDPEVIAAALLHDTIEDTVTDYDDLEGRFGRTIADTVAALTKNMALREDRREEDYENRLSGADWRVRLIKLADAYDNLHDAASYRGEAGPEPKHVHRAKIAVGLASGDEAASPAVARALLIVRGAISRLESGRT